MRDNAWTSPVIAVLPQSPRNGSPVPWLTSLYYKSRQRSDFGDARYPGNCPGELIMDLLKFYRPQSVLDPMTGSGTCADVCRAMRIRYRSFDITGGFDACAADAFADLGTFEFIWVHPPYWRQKVYSNDARDLSKSPSLPDFLERYEQFIHNAVSVLVPGGKLAILMGNYCDHDEGYVDLVYETKRLCREAGLRQKVTDIIRFAHGSSSSRRVYRNAIIPSLHDVCIIFEKVVRS